MKFFGIIPARYASTRFPGKPLVNINGKSMIQRVYERAVSAGILSKVVVATDDDRIFNHVSGFGEAVMTSASHASGTDRCFEAASFLKEKWNIVPGDVIVNIQGDEPFIHPEQINTICSCFDDPSIKLATLMKRITHDEQLFNENVVKVVAGANGNALYFSRSAIPVVRGVAREEWLHKGVFFKHIGMYAYQMDVLAEITRLAQSLLEKTESLEQLRWLENGYTIAVRETQLESHAVDIPEDLQKFESTKQN